MKSPVPRLGKVGGLTLSQIVRSWCGASRSEVLLGPGLGLDFGVVDLGSTKRLLLTTDPLYIEPSLGWARAAWFGFHILATDLAVSGSPPQFLSLDWNLPPTTEESTLRALMRGMDREARKYGTAIVAGHTGRYAGSAWPMVGGGTAFSVVGPRDYVNLKDARSGDHLLVTGAAGLETTALLAHVRPREFKRLLGTKVWRESTSWLTQLSPVDDTLALAELGLGRRGISGMHDVAEGGVLRSLHEFHDATRLGGRLDLSRVPRDPTAEHVARVLGYDTLSASSQGSLLVSVVPSRVADAVELLERRGRPVADLGVLQRPGSAWSDRGHSLDHAGTDGLASRLGGPLPRRYKPRTGRP